MSDPLPPFTLPGYEVIRYLGGGGAGRVFLARSLQDGAEVAVKFLVAPQATAVTRFKTYRQLFSALSHPNFVRVIEVGGPPQTEGYYLVMEHASGGALDSRLAEFKEPRTAGQLVRTLAGALAYLHERDCIHRDVKPANILFRSDGTPCLADFDYLRPIRSPVQITRLSETVGTPEYASPEQNTAGVEVDEQTDVYSLGVILYELLTGARPPLQGDWRPSRRNPAVPAFLDQICLGCLREQPAHRYSAGNLVKALEAFLNGMAVPPRPAIGRPDYPKVWLGSLEVGVCLLVGGDARTRYRHGGDILCTHRDELFPTPADVQAATSSWLETRVQECRRTYVPFVNRKQIRLDEWGSELTDEPIERPHPLYLSTSATEYFTTQQTHGCMDFFLPDRRTVREAHAGGIDDFADSRLGNPLAVNLTLITSDNWIYLAQRGRRVGFHAVLDPNDPARVPAVSGTGSPDFDCVNGVYDPFETAVREAREEMLSGYPLSKDEITLFGLARVRSNFFPFLFGEARIRLTHDQLESHPLTARTDVLARRGKPFTIDGVVAWIKELHPRTLSHTAIFGLYQSLIYAHPDRIDEINAMLKP